MDPPKMPRTLEDIFEAPGTLESGDGHQSVPPPPSSASTNDGNYYLGASRPGPDGSDFHGGSQSRSPSIKESRKPFFNQDEEQDSGSDVFVQKGDSKDDIPMVDLTPSEAPSNGRIKSPPIPPRHKETLSLGNAPVDTGRGGSRRSPRDDSDDDDDDTARDSDERLKKRAMLYDAPRRQQRQQKSVSFKGTAVDIDDSSDDEVDASMPAPEHQGLPSWHPSHSAATPSGAAPGPAPAPAHGPPPAAATAPPPRGVPASGPRPAATHPGGVPPFASAPARASATAPPPRGVPASGPGPAATHLGGVPPFASASARASATAPPPRGVPAAAAAVSHPVPPPEAAFTHMDVGGGRRLLRQTPGLSDMPVPTPTAAAATATTPSQAATTGPYTPVADYDGYDNIGFEGDEKTRFTYEIPSRDYETTPLIPKDPVDEKDIKAASKMDPLPWDVFREFSLDTQLYRHEKLYLAFHKVMKILFILISFLLILGGLVFSKMTLLYATSNVHFDVHYERKVIYGSTANGYAQVETCGSPVCQIPETRRTASVRWVWCITLCVCTPYLLAGFKCFWKICFKKKRGPTAEALAFVMFMDTMHVMGLFMLLFIILPNLDLHRAILILCGAPLVPSFLQMFNPSPREKNKGSRGPKLALHICAFIIFLGAMFGWPFTEGVWKEDTCLVMSNATCSDVLGRPANSRAMPYNVGGRSAYLYEYEDPYNASQGEAAEENDYYAMFAADNGTMAPDNDTSTWGESTAAPPTTSPTPPPTPSAPSNYTSHPMPEMVPCNWWPFLVPVALLMISCSWWENFVDEGSMLGGCSKGLRRLHHDIRKTRTKIFAVTSCWKVMLFFALVALIVPWLAAGDKGEFKMNWLFDGERFLNQTTRKMEIDWLVVYGIQAGASVVTYFCSLWAIQAHVQLHTFSPALALATPACFSLAFWVCNHCDGWDIPGMDSYWNCFSGYDSFMDMYGFKGEERGRWSVYLAIAMWIAQMMLAWHIWKPKCERLAKSNRIFLAPMYCGALLEQHMMYNRRRNEKRTQETHSMPDLEDYLDEVNDAPATGDSEPLYQRAECSRPMIFVCATMWHENENEMSQILKSLIRLDADQCTRRLARDFFKVKVDDFYDFEAHIFFDDAFEAHPDGDTDFSVNSFVKQFLQSINKAAMSIHNSNMRLDHPAKIETPYGGRLVYRLPGGNKLYVHLKDKVKIRHRKRWSQVMYMYYLLGNRLWNQKEKKNRKEVVANNCYILALDGDVDFKPEAALLLLDLMQRNMAVGASCGRIHPVGSGPMVWYQKFEYSLSHWMQKSTEHVLGCVLCSPGCFSMFRASALMDDNVMKTYSKQAVEASEYVQYDQGEDRWLCTLLLKAGYRVEYSAAADAMTYAPEGFNEFFNQRRRWTPSTFANIMDLLAAGRDVVKKNENISMIYIIYQGGLFAASIVGPATIFLMIVGAFRTTIVAFANAPFAAFAMVFFPLVIFFIVCLLAPSGVQLGFAAILGGLFAAIQMIVIVSIISEAVENGFCSIDTAFFVFVAGVFILAALLHPQEFSNIVHGLIYFLAVPTMYLVLIIYSLCNLHDVSWGTRDVTQTRAAMQKAAEKKTTFEAKKTAQASSSLTGFFTMMGGGGGGGGGAKAEDGWTWSCGDSCRCMCCPRPGESPTDRKISDLSVQIATLTAQTAKVLKGEHPNTDDSDSDTEQPLLAAPGASMEEKDNETNTQRAQHDGGSNTSSRSDQEKEKHVERTWFEDVDLGHGRHEPLKVPETQFWVDLINRYLHPLTEDKEYQERVGRELKALRNKVVIGFFMIDVLLIVFVECLGSANVMGDQNLVIHYNCSDKPQTIEPVSFLFIIVFGIFMVIQVFGMLAHRFFSMLQFVSTTQLSSPQNREKSEMMELAKTFATLRQDRPPSISSSSGFNTIDSRTSSLDSENDNEGRRTEGLGGTMAAPRHGNITSKLSYNAQQQYAPVQTMDQAFAKRFFAMGRIANTGLRLTGGGGADGGSARQGPSHYEVADGGSVGKRRSGLAADIESVHSRQSGRTRRAVNRSKSVHDNAMRNLLSRRSDIFATDRVDKVQQRFNLTEDDLAATTQQVAQLVPVDVENDSGDDSDTSMNWFKAKVQNHTPWAMRQRRPTFTGNPPPPPPPVRS